MQTRRLLLALSLAATVVVPAYASPISLVGGRVLAQVNNGITAPTDDKNPLLLSDFFTISAHENAFGADAFAQLSFLALSNSFMKASATVVSGSGATAFSDDEWVDVLTITSATLALGTPVDLTTSYEWDGTASVTGHGFDIYSLNYDLGNLGLTVPQQFVCGVGGPCTSNTTAGSFDFQKSGILHTTVGATVDFAVIMNLSAGGSAGNTAMVNAIDTLQFFVDPLTPGVSYTTESGQTYVTPSPNGTPVPEPASLLLFGSGLIGASVRRWRTRRTAA